MTKTCTMCQEEKPMDEFHRNSRNKDGRAYRCKKCMNKTVNEHHKREDYRARQISQKADRTSINREYLWEHLNAHPCEHCGNTDPRVLEFDHINQENKSADISYLVTRASLGTLQEEITKCRVLCANCHRIRSAHQLGYWWTKLDTAYSRTQ